MVVDFVSFIYTVMDSIFKGLGFKKIIQQNPIRSGDEFIEYGGVFIKE